MNDRLTQLLAELERLGRENDAAVSERPRRLLNITRDTGEFLAVLVRATGARRILEIGTSNGYSTLWLAAAAQAAGGLVTTVERSDFKVGLARGNFERAALGASIRLVHGDAAAFLARAGPASVEFLFLDSERTDYAGWWPLIGRVLAPRGLLVVDNAVSHAGELAAFVALVRAAPGWTSCLVPVGKGEFLATRDAVRD
jgi:predicted O-methyltransferase YrrM